MLIPFHGSSTGPDSRTVAACCIEFHLDSLAVLPDPQAGRTATHQVVEARGVSMVITFEDGSEILIPRMAQTLHCVRGDDVDLSPEQAADADHWYVVTWVETFEDASTSSYR